MEKHSSLEKKLQDMSLEELHELAEPQNQLYDGVDAALLTKLLKIVGFKETKIFTYSSDRWNDGKVFNLVNSLSNNKIYTISVK